MTEPRPTCSLCGCHDDRDALIAENEQLQEDVRLAAGELMVDLAEAPPGSLVARLLRANRIMSRERDDSRAEFCDMVQAFSEVKHALILAEATEQEEQRVFCPKGCGLMYRRDRADDHSCMDS